MEGQKEIEIVFYTKIGDFTGLAKADKVEEHDQIECRMLNGNKTRIRKTSIAGEQPQYVFTAKVKKPVEAGGNTPLVSDSIEYSAPASEELFKAFEQIMEQRLVKTRYYFLNRSIILILHGQPIPIQLDNVGFEVDVFKKDGKVCEYVKVDVELDAIIDYMKQNYPENKINGVKVVASKLPFKPLDMIFPPTASEEQKALVKDLWENKFTSRPESSVPSKEEPHTEPAIISEITPRGSSTD